MPGCKPEKGEHKFVNQALDQGKFPLEKAALVTQSGLFHQTK
jgi:hypothetical protein